MEFFLTLTFLFAVGAFCGWVIELIFRPRLSAASSSSVSTGSTTAYALL